jgi:rfaE bifunctional protein nucleotidyltransferase chain/domain
MHTPDPQTKIVPLATLLTRRPLWRQQGHTVVWTNGCFDLLHAGHLQSLTQAAALGDILVVGVNSDASVRRLKGATRPICAQDERAGLLAALACVDFVCIVEEDTPVLALSHLQPDIHCKGAEYAPPHGKPIPELPVVTAYGGQIRFLPRLPEHSTTATIQRLGHMALPQRPGGIL